ncbi:MAG: toll/interleukin-1 receptor domain-containing protein, partial [Bacteroidota bacterium]
MTRSEQITNFFSQGELETALKALAKEAKGSRHESTSIIFLSEFNGMKRDELMGILRADDKTRKINGLVYRGQSLLADLDRDFPEKMNREVGDKSQSSNVVEPVVQVPVVSDNPDKIDVYFSYAWKDESNPAREAIVDELYAQLEQDERFNPIRDKAQLRYGDNIKEFMREIGGAKRILVFISKKYLKSKYCMDELHQIYIRSAGFGPEFLEKIAPVIFPEVKLSDFEDR